MSNFSKMAQHSADCLSGDNTKLLSNLYNISFLWHTFDKTGRSPKKRKIRMTQKMRQVFSYCFQSCFFNNHLKSSFKYFILDMNLSVFYIRCLCAFLCALTKVVWSMVSISNVKFAEEWYGLSSSFITSCEEWITSPYINYGFLSFEKYAPTFNELFID